MGKMNNWRVGGGDRKDEVIYFFCPFMQSKKYSPGSQSPPVQVTSSTSLLSHSLPPVHDLVLVLMQFVPQVSHELHAECIKIKTMFLR